MPFVAPRHSLRQASAPVGPTHRTAARLSPEQVNTLESGRAPIGASPVVQAQPLASNPSAFANLGISAPLLRAVADEGYSTPTPIQLKAIPSIAAGQDLLGSAQTGTGKTAAFVLPLLERLARADGHGAVRALVLTPTRELAAQIGERTQAYSRYLKLRHTVIYGGVSQGRQERELARKPEIVVATPGRLLDLMQQRFVSLAGVEILVLDEADTMLDMGFIHDVRKIVAAVPRKRQTLMFSATMPSDIESLARSVLTDPVRIAVAPVATTADTVEQSVHFVSKADKRGMLEQLLKTLAVDRALVFTRTKHGANKVSEQLSRSGIRSAAIHGNKSQGARERALGDFKSGQVPVLVATDIAARGIDVAGISHVINFDIPNVPETYVHRIGRAGRAGATGVAISLCDHEERSFLTDIERLIRRRISVADNKALPPLPPRAPAPAGSEVRRAAPQGDPAAGQSAPQRSGSPARESGGPGKRRRFRPSRRR
jgi:ATP-dependent RNA helicase RhlE